MPFDRRYIGDLDSDQLRNGNLIERIASDIVDDAECDDDLLVDLADRLLEIGELEAAERITEMLDEEWATEKAPLLCRVAGSFMELGADRRARRLIVRALITSGSCDVAWQRAEVLIEIASAFRSIGDTSTAVAILYVAVAFARKDEAGGSENIQDALDACGVLGDAAVKLAEFGFPEEAREIASKMAYARRRNVALSKIDRIQHKKS